MRRYLLAIPILALAGTLHAQDVKEFPFKPLPAVRVQLTCPKTDTVCQDLYHVKPGQKWWQPLPVQRRTADGAYLGVTAASLLLTVADIENSVPIVGNCTHGHEVNPLYGQCPSRGRYYAIAMPIFAATSYFSYKWKREDDALRDASIPPHRGWARWWVPEAANAGSHLVGIIVTLAATGK
jgi:hypothetical protein